MSRYRACRGRITYTMQEPDSPYPIQTHFSSGLPVFRVLDKSVSQKTKSVFRIFHHFSRNLRRMCAKSGTRVFRLVCEGDLLAGNLGYVGAVKCGYQDQINSELENVNEWSSRTPYLKEMTPARVTMRYRHPFWVECRCEYRYHHLNYSIGKSK